jgi:hypothetical protein
MADDTGSNTVQEISIAILIAVLVLAVYYLIKFLTNLS